MSQSQAAFQPDFLSFWPLMRSAADQIGESSIKSAGNKLKVDRIRLHLPLPPHPEMVVAAAVASVLVLRVFISDVVC